MITNLDIEFIRFKVRGTKLNLTKQNNNLYILDIDSDSVLFEINKPPGYSIT
jgi:hypothetical protein